MHKIIWDNGSISMITNSIDASSHKHWMFQLFYTPNSNMNLMIDGNLIEGRMILVNTDVVHTFQTEETVHFSMLIMPGSELGEHLEHGFLMGQMYCDLSQLITDEFEASFQNSLHSMGKTQYFKLRTTLYEMLQMEKCERSHEQLERVKEVYSQIEKNNGMTMDEIADAMAISPSRLAHVFKEGTGMPLKSFLVINKCFTAIQSVLSGTNITKAAMDAGFDSPSHLAYTIKKFTGTSTSDATKNSEFLKVE